MGGSVFFFLFNCEWGGEELKQFHILSRARNRTLQINSPILSRFSELG